MTTKWKALATLGVVAAVVLIALGYYQFSSRTPEYAGEETPSIAGQGEMPPVASVTPATGNIDDAADAILAEILDAQSAFAAEEGDKTLLASDSQEIGNFGQSYDENEF